MIYKRDEYIEESPSGSKIPVKHIEMLTPIEGGQPLFVGQLAVGLSTPLGVQQIPVTFPIDAATVKEAFDKFESCAEPKIEETRKQIEEEIGRARREASSRIVTPGEVGLGGMGGVGGAPGQGPGVGNISKFRPR